MFSFGYIIDSQICIAILYLLYVTLLHRRVPHRTARLFLMVMIPIGLVIPLINLPLLPSPVLISEALPVDYLPEYSDSATITETPVPQTINYILIIYLAGVALMASWIAIGAIKLSILLKRSRPERIEGLKVIFTEQKISAFSVFNYIFVNIALRRSELLRELLAHEECHIKLRHTIDLIVMSITRSALWFNPIVWHTGHLMRQIHEYQVDEQVIKQGYSTKNYVNLLLISEAGITPEFASPLSYSLTKKRLKMLTQKQQNNRTRLFLTIPVVAILMSAFSLTTRAAVETTVEFTQDTVRTQTTKVIIRGISDSNSASKPLVVIDGNVSDSNIGVPMDKIKSFSIIKDSAAIKIYGSEAKNGAIVMTTIENYDPLTAQTDSNARKSSSKIIVRDNGNIDHTSSTLSIKDMSENATLIIDGKEVSYDKLDEVDPKDIAKFVISKGNGNDKKILYITTKIEGRNNEVKVIAHSHSDPQANLEAKAAEIVVIETSNQDQQQKNRPRDYAEKMPSFPGGEAELLKFLRENVKYPLIAQSKGIQGRVLVRFAVMEDGTINNVTVLRSVEKALDEEAVRVIKSMPKWNPGMQKGEPVAVNFALPINFTINTAQTPTQNTTYTTTPPGYIGGESAMMKFITDNLKYPADAVKNNIEGKVIVKFWVDKDGTVSEPSVLYGAEKSLNEEALRVIKSMPKWEPGKQNGEPIRTVYMIPVTFKLDK